MSDEYDRLFGVFLDMIELECSLDRNWGIVYFF